MPRLNMEKIADVIRYPNDLNQSRYTDELLHHVIEELYPPAKHSEVAKIMKPIAHWDNRIKLAVVHSSTTKRDKWLPGQKGKTVKKDTSLAGSIKRFLGLASDTPQKENFKNTGSLEKLRDNVETAYKDYRDLLYWKYPSN